MFARLSQIVSLPAISFYLLLAVGAADTAFAQKRPETPLTLTQILTGLKTQGKTEQTKTLEARNEYIMLRARQRGIDFQLDPEGEKSLIDAGASGDLIGALRKISAEVAAQRNEKEKQRQFDEAKDFYDRGQKCPKSDHDCRIANFTKAIEANPDFAQAYLYRGFAYAKKEHFNEALGDYTKAIELNPKDAFAYNNRGVVYAKINNFDEAIDDYNRAIELSPNDGNNYHNRGIAYAKINKFEMALGDYTKAIELIPNFGTAYKNRGNVNYNLKNFDWAIEDYNRAIELDPRNADFMHRRADAYFAKNDYQQSITDYTRAIELNPFDSVAYEFRAYAYEQIGERSKAIADSRRAEVLKNRP